MQFSKNKKQNLLLYVKINFQCYIWGIKLSMTISKLAKQKEIPTRMSRVAFTTRVLFHHYNPRIPIYLGFSSISPLPLPPLSSLPTPYSKNTLSAFSWLNSIFINTHVTNLNNNFNLKKKKFHVFWYF